MIADANASNHEPSLAELRHTAAHVLAYAVQDLFPEAKPTIGPAIENGFYYDFDRAEAVHARRSRAPGGADERDRGGRLSHDRARGHPRAKRSQLLKGTPTKSRSLRRSPKVSRSRSTRSATSPISAAAATQIRPAKSARSSSPALPGPTGAATSIIRCCNASTARPGTIAPSSTRILARIEEAQRRDHRKLGAELDLFSIEEDAGGGLVFWHPKGAIVRGIIEAFIREGLRERGYQPVFTPHVVNERLYEISGHLGKLRGRTCSDRSKSKDSASVSSR